MIRRTQRFIIALAALALVSALSSPGIFLWPLNAFRMGNYYADGVLLVAAVDFLRILFLVVPLASLVFALRGSIWATYGVIAFPLIAWVFGASAIPFLSHVFPPVVPRTIAVTTINLGVMATAAWVQWGKPRSPEKTSLRST
jgi:hypothetical protein